MKFSLAWLKRYIETEATVEEVAATLNAIGLEVEAIEDPAARLAGFRVARVLTAARHPDADKLQVLTVDTGDGDPLQVVCGAPNARAGLVGVLGLPGATVPANGMVLKVAGTLVSGWNVFGLAGAGSSGKSRADAGYAAAQTYAAPAPAAPLLPAQSRTPAVSAASAAAMHESTHGGGSEAGRSGDRRTVVTQVTGGGVEPVGPSRDARARGIGSRFRSASNDTGRMPAKEKIR